VFGGLCMCGHQLIGGADVLRPRRVGSRRIGTARRGDTNDCVGVPVRCM